MDHLDIGHRHYVVADVEPLDVSGVRTVAIGSVVWLVAFVVLLAFAGSLKAHGELWWMWTCLAGGGFGLVGLQYCRRRRDRLARRPEQPD